MPSSLNDFIDAMRGERANAALNAALEAYFIGGCGRTYSDEMRSLRADQTRTLNQKCQEILRYYGKRTDHDNSYSRMVVAIASTKDPELKTAMDGALRIKALKSVYCITRYGETASYDVSASQPTRVTRPVASPAVPAAAGAGGLGMAVGYGTMAGGGSSSAAPSRALEREMKQVSGASTISELKTALPASISSDLIASATDFEGAVRRVFKHVYKNTYPVYVPDRRPQFQETVVLPLKHQQGTKTVTHVHVGEHGDESDDSDEDHEEGTFRLGYSTYVDSRFPGGKRLSYREGETYRCKSGGIKKHGVVTYQDGAEAKEVDLASHDCYYKIKNTTGGNIHVLRHLQGFTEEGGEAKRLKQQHLGINSAGFFTYQHYTNGMRLHRGLLQHHAIKRPLSLSSDAVKAAYLMLSDNGELGRIAYTHASRLGFERILFRDGYNVLSCEVQPPASAPPPKTAFPLTGDDPTAAPAPTAPLKPSVARDPLAQDPC